MYINSLFTALVEFPGSQLPYIGTYRADLVILSLIIAITGAWAGLACLARAESLENEYPVSARLWKLAGGVGFGGSIWGMHFVGMLAFSLPCGISYDFLTTTLSIIPGILASLTAMAVVGRTDFGLYARLTVGSVLMGAGIGTMHYAGMAAMRLPAILMYEPVFVALSVAAAVGLSFIALMFVEYGRRDVPHPRTRQFVAAIILGAAVASMHYIAMQAAIFYPTLEPPRAEGHLSQGVLAILVGLGTLVLAGAVAAASFAARLRQTARNLAEEVEQRIEAEKAARADQTRLQAIFDTAVEAIIVINKKGLIQQWSRSAERIFGYTADEAIGCNVALIMDGINPAAHDRYLMRYQVTGDARIIGNGREVIGRRRDGTTVPLDLSVGETKVDGETFYTGILRDVTQRKQLEKELIETVRAKEANDLRANFLAHMSHEMRTPLNAILGFSDIMKMEAFGKLDSNYRSYAEDIFTSGSQLLKLVDTLLELAHAEETGDSLTISDFDVQDVLRDAVRVARLQAREKNLVVSLLVDNDLPDTIRTDREKYFQILVNVLHNAVKYSHAGNRVSVKAWCGQNDLSVRIEDHGVGMTESELAQALTAFVHVDDAFTAGEQGVGLGLPVVTSFVELLNGNLDIRSRKDEGTSVTVRIPFSIGEDAAALGEQAS